MQLIINADDFGLTSGVNRGILECFWAGSVTSTTLIVNAPATFEAVAIARDNPNLGVGLHLNFTLGRPLCPPDVVPTIVDKDGNFLKRSVIERRLIFGNVKTADIEREFQAQLDRFNHFGIPLTHIDSHQHVHLFPKVFDVLANYCSSYGIPLRLPWVWHGKRGNVLRRKKIRAFLLSILVRRHSWKWQNKIQSNLSFGSIFDLCSESSQISEQSYRHILTAVKKFPFELMVHPAIADESLYTMTQIAEFSKAEHRILSNPKFFQELSSFGYQFISYAAVPGPDLRMRKKSVISG